MRSLFALMLLPLAFDAGAKDGNALIADCHVAVAVMNGQPDAAAGSVSALYCMGLVKGVYDSMHMFVTKAFDGRTMCYPATMQTGQLTRIVSKFLDDHPVLLNDDDTTLAAFAFMQAFSCPVPAPAPPASRL